MLRTTPLEDASWRREKRAKQHRPNPPKKEKFSGSIYGSDVNPQFALFVKKLEVKLGIPIWVFSQSISGSHVEIDDETIEMVISAADEIPERVGLLINSPGGLGRPAYRLSRLFQDRCTEFTVIIPRMAKSAATLISLGADRIILGPLGEFGPLDVQIFDPEREERISALDETQAVEALENAALETADTLLALLKGRTGKKTSTLLPEVLNFSAKITQPLFDKVDAVRFSQMSRALRQGEEMAIRLLKRRYSPRKSKQIASLLVSDYTDHNFVIDHLECKREIGLEIEAVDSEVDEILNGLYPFLASFVTRTPAGIEVLGEIKKKS